MKRIVQVTSVVAALLLGVGTAWAMPPERGTFEFFFNGCVDPSDPEEWFPLYNCGGTADPAYICEAGMITKGKWKLFFDNEGNPDRYWETYHFDGYIYEWDDPENLLPYSNSVSQFKFDEVTGESVYTGVWGIITVPGYGQIFRDVGRIVFDFDFNLLFEAGEHEYWNNEFEAVCDFLLNGD